MSAGSNSKESMIGTGFQMNDLAVSIGGVEKRADRIGAKLRQDTEDWISARSGRILG